MFSIIDLETTGKSAQYGKITEVAIYVHDGTQIVDEYSTLINPEERVTAFITGLTGITNEMLEDAPKFYEVAKKIVEMTENTVFVAHNVGFDYSFMRSEFKRLGYDYQREKLCTARLSRKLIPGQPSYSLGKLCANLGIPLEDRHRAHGDARATVRLFELLIENDRKGLIQSGSDPFFALKDLHPDLDREVIRQLPESAGVYYLNDEHGQLLYIGKSKNIKSRVLSHLRNSQTKRAAEMRGRIASVHIETTGSELIALLKESEEIKRLQPPYNRAQKRSQFQYQLVARYNSQGYLQLDVSGKQTPDTPVTAFATRNEAVNQLHRVVEEFDLCQRHCNLYQQAGPCFNKLVHKCNGACVGEEEPEVYNERVMAAVDSLKQRFANLLVIDEGRETDERAVVLFEDGRYLGYGYFPVSEAVEDPSGFKPWIKPMLNNRDVHLIVWNYLKNNRVERAVRF